MWAEIGHDADNLLQVEHIHGKRKLLHVKNIEAG